MRAWIIGVVTSSLLIATAPPQSPAPRVWIHATVTDAAGHVVTDLQQRDFTVTDNGTVRPISVFSRDELPVAMSLMLDISGSMAQALPNVRRAAELLLDQFIDGDRVNVGTFRGEVSYAWGFTANRKKILEAIDVAMQGGDIPCSLGPGKPRIGGTWMWDAVECGIKVLRTDGEAFRRVLVLVTDGKENGGYATASSATRLANEVGVLLYAVGLQGIDGRDGALLRDLSQATGGGYLPLEEKGNYDPAFRRIAEELHGQYVLAFESQPGASGKLSVTVSRPGLKVRARHGYQIAVGK